MRLAFKRSDVPGPWADTTIPVVVPICADTGEEIEGVVSATVVSVAQELSRMTIVVQLQPPEPAAEPDPDPKSLVGARVRLIKHELALMPGMIMDIRAIQPATGWFLLRLAGGDSLNRTWTAPRDAFILLKCRVCGCDHLDPCVGPREGPCGWSLTEPDLCTACEGKGSAA